MKKLVASMISLCFMVLTGCHLKTAPIPLSETEKETAIDYTSTPTVFIHGAGGGKYSFGGMIKRFEKQEIATKSLVITVASNGQILTDADRTSDSFSDNNPMVQVLFEDNRNNEWEQAAWIKSVLVFLQQEYGVKEVNLVGHSMGGISGFRYLLQDGRNNELPSIKKFIAIGSPFNEFLDTLNNQTLDNLLANGPSEKSERYILYENEQAGMPIDVDVCLIAGKISDEDLSDKTVPLSSALAINSMVQQNGNPISVEVIEGKGANHSGLHENSDVDTRVSKFLWYKK